MLTIEQARDVVLSECEPLQAEDVLVTESLGRALAEPIIAHMDIPPFANSAMDGFAVISRDTDGASAESPRVLRLAGVVRAGDTGQVRVDSGMAWKIMTGAPMPAGADAVVEVESTREEDGLVFVLREVTAGHNVRPAGEDSPKGATIFSEGTSLGPAEIGVLASLGRTRIKVHRLPTVSILATGSELVEPGGTLGPGQIYNSNSYTALAQCQEIGIRPLVLGIAPDEYSVTKELISRGLEGDVLITSGGVSVGDYDFVKEVQDDLGVERLLWRVAMKPGKPLSFGVYRRPHGKCVVFGVPGNPGASMVSFELFIRPALLRLMGHRRIQRPMIQAELGQDQPNREDRVHVVRVLLKWQGGRYVAWSTGAQGSGRLRAMVGADGLAFVPPDGGGRRKGDIVPVMVIGQRLSEVGCVAGS